MENNFDDKLDGSFEFSISRMRLKNFDDDLTPIEKSTFLSASSSLAWLETAAVQLSSFHSSYLQLKNTKV